MNVTSSSITVEKAVVVGLLLLLIFITGFWMAPAGKPYNVVVFTIHKLIAVGALALLAVALYQTNLVTRLSPAELTLGAAAGLFFLGTIISGALLSTDLKLPAAIQTMHRVTPFLIVLSTAGTLYLLLNRWPEG